MSSACERSGRPGKVSCRGRRAGRHGAACDVRLATNPAFLVGSTSEARSTRTGGMMTGDGADLESIGSRRVAGRWATCCECRQTSATRSCGNAARHRSTIVSSRSRRRPDRDATRPGGVTAEVGAEAARVVPWKPLERFRHHQHEDEAKRDQLPSVGGRHDGVGEGRGEGGGHAPLLTISRFVRALAERLCAHQRVPIRSSSLTASAGSSMLAAAIFSRDSGSIGAPRSSRRRWSRSASWQSR
jgi:hypothetical protein